MRIGVVFPQIEFTGDPVAIRDYAQAVEGMGYRHFLAYDHVLGADTTNRPDWTGAYKATDPFHEIFILFGYLAGLTEKLELVSGVVILPQRQTALVAKQAAEIDVLSGGRLRLGVGVGWNAVEFEALDKNFGDRGVRSEEQIALLRALWTEPVITFEGKWERVTEAGLNPMPVQRPIPIWIGGYAEATLKRVGRMGDGWFPWRAPDETMRAAMDRLRGYALEAGRDPSTIGIEPQLNVGRGTPDDWRAYVAEWEALGATHFCLGTMGNGFTAPDEHLEALARAAEALGVG